MFGVDETTIRSDWEASGRNRSPTCSKAYENCPRTCIRLQNSRLTHPSPRQNSHISSLRAFCQQFLRFCSHIFCPAQRFLLKSPARLMIEIVSAKSAHVRVGDRFGSWTVASCRRARSRILRRSTADACTALSATSSDIPCGAASRKVADVSDLGRNKAYTPESNPKQSTQYKA